ncbi:MAG: transcriptional regulator [Pseudomonadota bacterium]
MGTVTLSADREGFSLENFISFWRKLFGLLITTFFAGFVVFLLYVAFINRSEAVWTAENGWGYGFGVVGGSMMLLLLLYPLSKHWRAMTRHLSVKFWFRLHMVFGVLGPVLILMHSSYRLGSMNGRVALFCMLIVAISGLFGRYFYTRIHHGLYGRKATFESLRADSKELNSKLGPLFELKPKAKELLRDHETRALALPTGLLGSAVHWASTRMRAARLYRTVMRSLNSKLLSAAKLKGWEREKVRRKQLLMHEILVAHNKLIRQMLELHFYERLFAIWHLMHLPLFIMLIITGFVHVYAVHAY